MQDWIRLSCSQQLIGFARAMQADTKANDLGLECRAEMRDFSDPPGLKCTLGVADTLQQVVEIELDATQSQTQWTNNLPSQFKVLVTARVQKPAIAYFTLAPEEQASHSAACKSQQISGPNNELWRTDEFQFHLTAPSSEKLVRARLNGLTQGVTPIDVRVHAVSPGTVDLLQLDPTSQCKIVRIPEFDLRIDAKVQ